MYDEFFIKQAMALLPEIQGMKISHGRAAEILGIDKETLIEFYGDMGYPYFDGRIESLKKENYLIQFNRSLNQRQKRMTKGLVDFPQASLYIYPRITTIPATVGIGLAARTCIRGGAHQPSC